jgi:aminopeptidase N
MKEATPQTIFLKDYSPTPYLIEEVFLTFDLHSSETRVTSQMKIARNKKSQENSSELFLNGEELKFISAKVDGKDWEVEVKEEGILLRDLPELFDLHISNVINPEANKALDGLYKSGPIFCTQNEPEGFRRITYYLDRPDVMAKFTTKVIAPKSDFPVLLSNGNPIDEGDLEDGKHFVTWEDPFPKPAYLYALVAGDLGLVQDSYKTISGRTIDLRIYCDKGNESRCDHAMESLKKSMKWDEDTFGLEYDLDIYMIVAVDSFNMGAMENKGLNIFNSVYVLANQETATDDNFLGIESVVGHEYFHNWTGNRITCRDWFQLTLKEGLTVYRDQEFSADLNSRTVQRISDVQRLRSFQFVEDAGPTAHPIKPDSYIEINNFYTATIYEKGAEIIRMVRTMLGVDGFRRGMDKYFELFDGQAVTTEDFLHSMSVANGDFDFSQFKNWYAQAGTPLVKASWSFDETAKEVRLELKQSCKATPGQSEKPAFHFPFRLGILNAQGEDVDLKLKNRADQTQISDGVVHVKEQNEVFIFEGIESFKTMSLNRGFSAPVRLDTEHSKEDFYFLMGNDNDLFNQYEAMQTVSLSVMRELIECNNKGEELLLDQSYSQAFGEILKNKSISPAVMAMILSLPAESIVQQGMDPVDFLGINKVRSFVRKELAAKHQEALKGLYDLNTTPGEYKLDPESIGKRSLRNTCLGYLSTIESSEAVVVNHFDSAKNMTDEISSLAALSKIGGAVFEKASSQFYSKWSSDNLVMQKWLMVEASAKGENILERVKTLESDAVYDKNIPNLVRNLIGGFAKNTPEFHHASGRGYAFVADKIIELDKINPQVASRTAGVFKDYKRLVPAAKELMGSELSRIVETKDLSKNVYEIVSKILK